MTIYFDPTYFDPAYFDTGAAIIAPPPPVEVEGRYRARLEVGAYAARAFACTYRLRSIIGRWRALE